MGGGGTLLLNMMKGITVLAVKTVHTVGVCIEAISVSINNPTVFITRD